MKIGRNPYLTRDKLFDTYESRRAMDHPPGLPAGFILPARMIYYFARIIGR